MRELYSSIGVSTADLYKVINSSFLWAVIPFESNSEMPIAIFSYFDCPDNLVKRLNAFVEGAMHLMAIPKSEYPLEMLRFGLNGLIKNKRDVIIYQVATIFSQLSRSTISISRMLY